MREQRVAVGRCVRDRLAAIVPVAAAAVIDYHRLAESLGETAADGADHDVVPPPGWIGNHDGIGFLVG